MPDQRSLRQESYPIIHAANLWWLSALVSEDLILLKHAQKEEKRHLWHVHSRIECNFLKCESRQEESHQKQGDCGNDHASAQKYHDICLRKIVSGQISLMAPSRETSLRTGMIPGTAFI
jgi:hypothetical protein